MLSNFKRGGLLFLILVLLLTSCSAPPTAPAPVSKGLNGEEAVIFLTGNPRFGAALVHENGEAIALEAEVDENAEIADLRAATWFSADGMKSVTVYFRNGAPYALVTEGYLQIFIDNADGTAEVVTVAPDGSQSVSENVPFESSKIPKLESGSRREAGERALMRGKNKWGVKQWLRVASIGIGVAACAGMVASGGGLTPVLGVTCASAAVNIYTTVKEITSPVVDASTTAVSTGFCVAGVITASASAPVDCAIAFVDIGEKSAAAADAVVKKNESLLKEIEAAQQARQPSPQQQEQPQQPSAPEQPQPSIGMANPASVYCLQQGYKSENRLDASGNAYGVCVFPNGSECDEWAFYNGQCKPTEENEAARYVGAYTVVEYTRMRDAPESDTETVTVRRIEEIAAAVDNLTIRIAVRYEGDGGGMLNTEPWSYLVDIESGAIRGDDSKGHVLDAFGSLLNTTADALIYKVGYEEVIDGWSFQWQGFSKRDLKTHLLIQSETACEVYDPQGRRWGRYADKMTLLEIHIP